MACKPKSSTAALILGLTFLAAPLRADNFSISLDGAYNRLFAQQEADSIGHWNAVGPSLQLQYHPVDSFSIGVDVTALVYWGVETPGPVLAQSANLALRYILNPGSDTTFYLMAMGGLNPQLELSDDLGTWGHDHHVTGGVGCWFFLGPTTAINFGAGYDLLGHDVAPLNNVQGRVGLTFFTSPAVDDPPSYAARPEPKPTPMATPEPLSAKEIAATADETDPFAPQADERGARKVEAGMEMSATEGSSDLTLSDAEGRAAHIKAGMEMNASEGSSTVELTGAAARRPQAEAQGLRVSDTDPIQVSDAEQRKADVKAGMKVSATDDQYDADIAHLKGRELAAEEPSAEESLSPTSETNPAAWWDEPLDPQTAYKKLRDEMVPEHIGKMRITELGKKAKTFFDELQKRGYKVPTIQRMRAGYYAAVAIALDGKGHKEKARYYADFALQVRPGSIPAKKAKKAIEAGEAEAPAAPAAEVPAPKAADPEPAPTAPAVAPEEDATSPSTPEAEATPTVPVIEIEGI